MKSFRIQFKECKDNGTLIVLDDIRPNIQRIKSIKINQAYFCNKHMKRCSSSVCYKERNGK